jgi:hypothetical protein
LLAELIDLAEQRDEAGLMAQNLLPGTQLALSRLLGISKEIRAMQNLLERRLAEEAEAEAVIMSLLQRLP